MRTKILILVAASVFIMSCNFTSGRRVKGDGNLSTQQRSVGDFGEVAAVGGINIVLSNGAAYGVKVSADENLQEYIETKKDGDRLVIKTRDGYRLRSRNKITINVTAPAIRELEVVGSGSIVSDGRLAYNSKLHAAITGSGEMNLDVDAPEVTTRTTGSGDIMLRGTTRRYEAVINGSGSVKSGDLLSENTEVKISGSGNAMVFASKQLGVNISGSGDVAYKGSPAVNQSISGSGSIRQVQ